MEYEYVKGMGTTVLGTAAEVIDALGGTAAVAKLTRRSSPQVCNWRAENRISHKVFPKIKTALDAKGLAAAPLLFGFEPPESPKGNGDAGERSAPSS